MITTPLYLFRDGQKLGPYSLEQIARLLKENKISLTDPVWFDGAAGSVPLSSVPGIDASIQELLSAEAPMEGTVDGTTQPFSMDDISAERNIAVGHFAQVTAYASISEVARSGVHDFLKFLGRRLAAETGSNAAKKEAFFKRFLSEADSLTAKSCQEVVKIVLHATVRPEIRDAAPQVLAARIRELAFAELDTILLNYVMVLKEVSVDLKQTINLLQESHLRDEAHKVVTGSWLTVTPDEGPVGADAGRRGPSSHKICQQEEFLTQQHELKLQAQSLVFSEMIDYVEMLGTLPAALVDFGGKKCFGGDVDFALQKKVVTKDLSAIEDELTSTVQNLLHLASAERKELGRLRSEATARIQAVEKTENCKERREAVGVGLLATTGICLFPAWVVILSSTPSRGIKTLAVVGGVIALFTFFCAVSSLAIARRPSVPLNFDDEKLVDVRDRAPVSATAAEAPQPVPNTSALESRGAA
jgi:hypothetical protein